MAKSVFKIAYVERGYEPEWRGFWVTGDKSPAVKEAHEAGKLGLCEFVEARNRKEAIAKVRAKFPDHTVMDEGSDRIGG